MSKYSSILRRISTALLLTIVVFVLWILAHTVCASAQPVMIEEGDAAPFRGVLMTVEDAAALVSRATALERISIQREVVIQECEEVVDTQAAEMLTACQGELALCFQSAPEPVACPECVGDGRTVWDWLMPGLGLVGGIGIGVLIGWLVL